MLNPETNVAVISTQGPSAALEAMAALDRGVHVFCPSNHVSIEDEVRLKALARERGLLFMGPDCGSAIIDGVPFGFANATRRGPIGIVAASGSGMREVVCLLDRGWQSMLPPFGISQAVGVGSRDLSAAVSGPMMLASLEMLADDPQTELIVLIATRPDPMVASRVWLKATKLEKPVIVCFQGWSEDVAHNLLGGPVGLQSAGFVPDGNPVGVVSSLFEAAITAAHWGNGYRGAVEFSRQWKSGEPGQPGRLLGLFSGEAVLREAEGVLRDPGSIGLNEADPGRFRCELMDLGGDAWSTGESHPIVDPQGCADRIRAAAYDRDLGIILLDGVLGFGAHADPASVLAPSIREARAAAAADGRHLVVIASLCGTVADSQGWESQRKTLAAAGAIVMPSVFDAACHAAFLMAAALTVAG
ncbi:MAG: transcriptional regulator [Chloroflexi bacterium]|nr:transcriptional regulator [Chloroflexota bacterium]